MGLVNKQVKFRICSRDGSKDCAIPRRGGGGCGRARARVRAGAGAVRCRRNKAFRCPPARRPPLSEGPCSAKSRARISPYGDRFLLAPAPTAARARAPPR
ncbi:hypothetical protein EVAR_61114_1 [Eumeta japonica]|uniref:Uncharacterized protein n=1 Tax=Eumeta variegata TaxID=151549 RepID=A0A4C1YQD2_EUMVA|nr:hypothetical protein EVAR_61114_1 [Eumeta japonica]